MDRWTKKSCRKNGELTHDFRIQVQGINYLELEKSNQETYYDVWTKCEKEGFAADHFGRFLSEKVMFKTIKKYIEKEFEFRQTSTKEVPKYDLKKQKKELFFVDYYDGLKVHFFFKERNNIFFKK